MILYKQMRHSQYNKSLTKTFQFKFQTIKRVVSKTEIVAWISAGPSSRILPKGTSEYTGREKPSSRPSGGINYCRRDGWNSEYRKCNLQTIQAPDLDSAVVFNC